ncbi:hypothetical protein ACSQ6I_13700 [Anabaena sp. WFMT]|uniref:hypothetical protein n=1 Tax=Anabaena sp. WFMT TaxID=3449730 RepID=UPI003F216C67
MKLLFEALEELELGCQVAIAHLPIKFFIDAHPEIEPDQDYLTCLRSCLIKPEHLDWVEDIWQILQQVNNQILTPELLTPCPERSRRADS